MREDIEVAVAHMAPVLLQARRGTEPSPAVARQVAPARIRYVDPEALAPARAINGSYATVNGGLRGFEGRLWRGLTGHLPWGTGRSGYPLAGPREVAAALSDPAESPLRNDLYHLTLTPWCVKNQYGRLGEHAKVLDANALDPRKLALDLRDETASAMSRRVSTRLVHDGRSTFVAIDAPKLHLADRVEVEAVETPMGQKISFSPMTSPEFVEEYIAYQARTRVSGDLTRNLAERLRERAASLAVELAGLEPDPNADLRRNLRRLVILARETCGTHDRGEGLKEAVRAMAPFIARATADLIDDDHLVEAHDRLAAYVSGIDHPGKPGNSSHTAYARNRIAAYILTVAKPRIGGTFHEVDLESLGALAP